MTSALAAQIRAAVAQTPRSRSTGVPGERRAQRALLGLAGLLALLPVIFIPLTLPLGWDEIVYASRFGPFVHGLEVPFEAPRTRGVPVLLSPVAAWSDSVVLLRGWMSILAGAGLYAGFQPWLRVFPARPMVVPLAAAGYCSLWFVLFYVSSAMPNHYTAMGAMAAVGCFIRYVSAERRRHLLYGIAGGLAPATLMRPNDAVWIAGPLLVAVIAYRPWRTLAPVVAMTAGVLIAAIPWVIESEVRFGGVADRLTLATDQQGGMRPQLNFTAVVSSLDGPLLCRPCNGDGLIWPTAAWWFALPVLVAASLLFALRSHPDFPRAAVILPTAVATSSAVTYVFFIDYAAARFLLTTYALLMVPAALALHRLWHRARARRRPWVIALVLLLAFHLATSLGTLHAHAHIQASARQDFVRISAALRVAGVRGAGGDHCVLDGNAMVIPVAYLTGCRPAGRGSPSADALILRNAEVPSPQRHWRLIPVPGTYNQGWRIAVP